MNTHYISQRLQASKLALFMTRAAFDLWLVLDHDETRGLLRACAVNDWGSGTEVLFGQDFIVVEHLDGRTVTLKRPKAEISHKNAPPLRKDPRHVSQLIQKSLRSNKGING